MMKKINLSIQNPCTQNWNKMADNEKGKLCNSCQKSVIDFTNMTDRQLVDFFKKPLASVCGRLNQDQLNRDIDIPGKRIPWLKYFFRIAFPAFIVSLKSCIPKIDVKQNIETRRPDNELKYKENLVMGELFYNMDSLKSPEKLHNNDKGFIKTKKDSNKINELDIIPITDSIHILPVTGINDRNISNKDSFSCFSGIMGGISSVTIKKPSRPISLIKKIVDTVFPKINIYPNPVQNGSNLNIKFVSGITGDFLISLISMSGSIVQNKEVKVEEKDHIINMQLEKESAGNYIIRLVNRSTGKLYTEKILIY